MSGSPHAEPAPWLPSVSMKSTRSDPGLLCNAKVSASGNGGTAGGTAAAAPAGGGDGRHRGRDARVGARGGGWLLVEALAVGGPPGAGVGQQPPPQLRGA